MNLLELIDNEGLKANVTPFRVGDTVKVYFKIVEGSKERIQVFEGLVIARKNGGIRETFTVRKISFGVGVERTFPVHSPRVEKIEVIREGDVRRAKLYYIRDLSGKAATRVKEKKHVKQVTDDKGQVTKKEKPPVADVTPEVVDDTKKPAKKEVVKEIPVKKPMAKKLEGTDKK